MSFQMRLAKAADVPTIQGIVRDAYGHYIERMGRVPAPMTANYLELVEAGSVWVLAAESDIAGLIVLRQADDHLLVSNVAVGGAQQGRGLGRALLAHAETHARQAGIHELRLYTHELMHENLSIYTRLGWEEYSRGEQDGFRRVFMRKRLAPAVAAKTGHKGSGCGVT